MMLLFIFSLLLVGSKARRERPPEFAESTSEKSVTVGNTAILSCAVHLRGNHTVTWRSPQKVLISFGDRLIIDDPRIGVKRPYLDDWDLHIRDVRLSDSGLYHCSVNSGPVMTKSVSLKVVARRPRIVQDALTIVSVTEGEYAILPCLVRDLGEHKVTWWNPQKELISFEDRRVIYDFRISVQRPYVGHWDLHIRNVRLSDSGLYQCSINSDPVMNKSVSLKVVGYGSGSEWPTGSAQLSTPALEDSGELFEYTGNNFTEYLAAEGTTFSPHSMRSLAMAGILVIFARVF